ncbi:hypothetical protein EYF80_033553 [Liparis tanakae]|uniref:Uncharacterized protein n=1 Tax=Liparis tanakae TaxID=230148 RepID=A0A4Z2GSP0_9TELE|nr:hypothetical protein EYF80_033553 [Liparis tanakae]
MPVAVVVDMALVVVVDVLVVVEPVFIVGMTAADSFSFSFSLSALSSDQCPSAYLLVRLVEPVRVEEEPRLESRPRWPVGEVTDEVVVAVVVEGVEEGVEEEVVEELRSSDLLPNEPLEEKTSRRETCRALGSKLEVDEDLAGTSRVLPLRPSASVWDVLAGGRVGEERHLGVRLVEAVPSLFFRSSSQRRRVYEPLRIRGVEEEERRGLEAERITPVVSFSRCASLVAVISASAP